MGNYRFSRQSLARLGTVHPELCRVAIIALSKSPYDFGISQGMRTVEEQEALYAQGRTKPGPIVTWTLKSKHLPQEDGYAHALDIVIYIDGKMTWDERYYIEVSDCFKQAAKQLGVKIVWGGDWTKKDYPHYEIVT